MKNFLENSLSVRLLSSGIVWTDKLYYLMKEFVFLTMVVMEIEKMPFLP